VCVPVAAKNAVAPLFFFTLTVLILIQVLGARGYACASQVTTIAYRVLEILLGASTYTGVVDVWSLGCIFAKMAREKNLFGGHSKIEV
jgi:serine/threonine protein kinase